MAKRITTKYKECAHLTNYEKEDWDAASFFHPEEWSMSFRKEWDCFWRERKQYDSSFKVDPMKRIALLDSELDLDSELELELDSELELDLAS